MLIRDLERKTGLDRATIRFYEKEGFIEPNRKDNGYREYTQEHLSHLLKIKLLRQLGMSLETIKGLQRGTEDFDLALSARILALEQQIKDAQKAKEVCTVLKNAHVSYATLDPDYYLNLFTEDSRNPSQTFSEPIERPFHPARRFFARITDYVLLTTIIEFIVVVILRIRPVGNLLSTIITVGTPVLAVPVCAIMLKYWGTTPGKWLYGLAVRSENGNHLHYAAAVDREWNAFRYGYGFGIVFWQLWRFWRSYRGYQLGEPSWDRYSEYLYLPWSRKRKAAIALTVVFIVSITLCTAFDLAKPKYRGELSVEEFAENYNYYYKIIDEEPQKYNMLQEDGTRAPLPDTVKEFYPQAQPENPRQDFAYSVIDDNIRSISYSNTWTEVSYLSPVQSECINAMYAVLMSQRGIGLLDLYQFAQQLETQDFGTDGTLEFENIEIVWEVDAAGCFYADGVFYEDTFYSNAQNDSDDEITDGVVSVTLEIRINSK